MIFDEEMQVLEDAYYQQLKEPVEPLTDEELMEVVYAYMVLYRGEFNTAVAYRRNRTAFQLTLGRLRERNPNGWPSGVYGMAETRFVLDEMRSENPFKQA